MPSIYVRLIYHLPQGLINKAKGQITLNIDVEVVFMKKTMWYAI